jgi:hypothetical protein
LETDSDVSGLNRGKLGSYPMAHVGSQFRNHTFTLSMCGRSTRLIHWDHGGGTVTGSLDYINEPHILASAFDYLQLLVGVRECNGRCHGGKTLFAHSDRRTNFSLPQDINMPISTLMSFIVTSARVISQSHARERAL